MNFPNVPAPKNPLGVISLFVALIYGMAGFVLTVSLDKLQPLHLSVFVWFLVLFPSGVFVAFVYLLVRHHLKFYGPQDYGDPKAFYDYSSQENTAARLVQDSVDEPTSHEAADASEAKLDATSPEMASEPAEGSAHSDQRNTSADTSASVSERHSRQGQAERRADYAREALLAETLVLSTLEREFDAAVRRDIRFRSTNKSPPVIVDGWLEAEAEDIFVEINFVRGDRPSSAMFAMRAIDQLRRIEYAVKSIEKSKPSRFVLVFVFADDVPARIQNRLEERVRSSCGFEARFLQMRDLQRRFGFYNRTYSSEGLFATDDGMTRSDD